jgi:NADH:ubiquinone oxidoreductase subunit 5 (subunit L)/multisubunit Na+/H+ antiporter MnhA subunit
VILLFLFDYISCVFFRTVLMISGAVMFYSSSYMMGDQFSSRFCILVLRFVISMGLLIFSPRLICMLLG